MKQKHKPLQPLYQNKKLNPPGRYFLANKPIKLIKSNYKFPNKKKKIKALAAKAKGGPGGLYGTFPSTRKRKDDMANVQLFGERENLI